MPNIPSDPYGQVPDLPPDFPTFNDAEFDGPPVSAEPPSLNAVEAPAELVEAPANNAEEALLGCILINPDAYYDVADILKPDDFAIIRNRWVWESCTRLRANHPPLPLDTLTIANDLQQAGQLAELGGTAYLARLMDAVPTSLHAEAYARLVERAATRRRLLAAAGQIAKLAVDHAKPIADVVNAAEAAIYAVSERRLNRDVVHLRDAVSAYVDRLHYQAEHKDQFHGVPTGFIDLDKLLGGLQRSDLLVVAGRPGSGKTGLMLNIAKNAAQLHGKHVAVFSLEMSTDQLVQRLLSQETGIDSHRLRTAELTQAEWDILPEATQRLSQAPIFLDDTPAITPTQLRSKCRRLDQELGLDLVIVDYLQLMQSDARSENRVVEIGHISRNLKALARELNVPVLAGAQLSRAVERNDDKRPMLSNLRESGSIENDSDIVMFIHRPDMYEKEPARHTHLAELIVAKHRNGPTDTVHLYYRAELTKFENSTVGAS